MDTPPTDFPTTPEARAAFIKQAQKNHDYLALKAFFEAELLASPAFAAAMAPYNPSGHASFAASYSSGKADLYTKGPTTVEAQSTKFLQFREAAADVLWHIQQKKLFDLQCQWRAEQLTLPQIYQCHDFNTWSHYIDRCDWLSPITADEVACYEAYLRSDSYDHESATMWQQYEDFKLSEDPDRQHEADEELPAWYAYHNAVTGAGALLSLPDIRGAKEEVYRDLWRAENQQEQEATQPESEKMPWPPSCSGPDDIAPFLDLFEASTDLPRLHRWRQAVKQARVQESWALEQAEYWYVCVLHNAGEAWPIKANADWRMALREAGIDYWRIHVADVLHEVWQEGEQHRAMGLPVTAPTGSRHIRPFEEIQWGLADTNFWSNSILRGRELAGEPRNFDF